MQLLDNHFEADEVTRIAVDWKESLAAVLDYVNEFGIQSPVLLDSEEEGAGCFAVPKGGNSLFVHYDMLVPGAFSGQPFPLQVVIDNDGRFAYLSRDHDPDALLDVLYALTGKARP